MNKNLYHHPCDFCGEETGKVVTQGGDLLEDLPGTFQMIRCDGCGVLRQDPRLNWEDLAEYYQPGYVCHGEQFTNEHRSLEEKARSLGPQKRIKRVAQYKSEGSWLDVGCGSGLILQAAQEWGTWQLSGVEPVTSMAKYTSNKLGIEVFPGTFEEFPLHEDHYDVITMWDVLEHLPYPSTSINKVSKSLKVNGLFLFSTPNLEALDRKLFKSTWLGYDLPRHLYLFPDELIKKVLRQNGLEIVDRFCFSGSHGAWYLDLQYKNKVTPKKLVKWLLKHGPSGWFFRLISFLPLRIVDWLKLGTNITYVARKL